MKRSLVLLYGIINYALGSAALLLLIAFLFNFLPANPVAAGIDAGESGNIWLAMATNLALVCLFGLQHSIMARPALKRWLTRRIPQAAERSTFMLATAVVTLALIVLWKPMPAVIWKAQNPIVHDVLLGIGLAGWALVFYSTFLINHFDLFGLRQVWLYFRRRTYTQLPFQLHGLYRYVRHPIMTGVFIGIWVTPVMSAGHLLFAVAMSAYILVGVYHEEQDLLKAFGRRYRHYIRTTGRFLPRASRGGPVKTGPLRSE